MKGKLVAWHFQNLSTAILNEMTYFEYFKISHIRRLGNREADYLSKWALTFRECEETRIEDFKSITNKGVELGLVEVN